MIDVVHQINQVHRTVAGRTVSSTEARTVTLRQTYDATVDELWDACTDPERIPRWFLPVTGELRVGGRYQLEGNAGGTITACEPPRRFEATWEFDGKVSWIAVEMSPADGDDVETGARPRAQLTLEHTVPVDDHWAQYGPGAVGVGWDMALIGMSLHLASGGAAVDAEEVMAWMASDGGRDFTTRSSQAWLAAHGAGGTEPDDVATAQARRTLAAYTGAEEE